MLFFKKLSFGFIWLGWRDSNPRNGGVKVRCLTAWLHPKILRNYSGVTLLYKNFRKVKINFAFFQTFFKIL